jgi:hypothetical protein
MDTIKAIMSSRSIRRFKERVHQNRWTGAPA